MKKSFDSQKAIEALVYIANMQHDLYSALKAVYFADKEHLRLFGRQMFNETYKAFEKGPAPSTLYDYLKCVRGDGVVYIYIAPEITKRLIDSLSATRTTVRAKREPNLDYLSKSEIQCLQKGLSVVAGKDFESIKNLSHDSAYNKTRRNRPMALEDIVDTLPNSELILDYIK